ncbi:MAG: ATP-binding cassette domain-containing protein [Clostridia bacterium]|nr:ATP-binding cassette domain-containing protein [Clostridia bacterium]
MAKKALRLLGVNKKYKLTNKDQFQALYDITVDFEKGELVSIVGESGSGKSTLMNLIGGLDSDFTGQIIADGENLGKLTDKELDKYRKNKVGFVFQSFNLISHLSILDNVTLALTLSNVPEKEKVEKATQLLKRLGLETQLKKNPTQLSGGQKQRVAIARALINDPEIIIADEPTGALDSQTSMQILSILKEIADSGKLVVMVTHSEKVASVSSRVVEISDGRIVSDRVNENYQKSETKLLEKDTTSPASSDKKKKKSTKDKQNLSLRSAIRLSLHNMWANRVKNLLMAFGVAIGIGSLILMMSFGSGINDFIDDTMKSYSNPEIVTVTKSSSGFEEMAQYKAFSDADIDELIDDINAYLTEKGEKTFRVDREHVTEGVQMMTLMTYAQIIYNPEHNFAYYEDYFNKSKLDELGLKNTSIYYLYTIPPYYSKTNVIDGELSTSEGGIMLTKGAKTFFEDGNPVGKSVDIAFLYKESAEDAGTKIRFYSDTNDLEIKGIMDTSVMSNYMVLYIDYQYFQELYKSQQGEYINPNTLYITTGSERLTNLINSYLATTNKYKGSIEDQLANMFSNISSTIGTSLSVISSISLLVSAIMILVVLYMSVTERTKEIGVMKSIGARRKDIKRIFTSESFLIGVLSGIMGIIFNLLLTLIVFVILKSTIGLAPISYRWWYFAIALGVSIFISMIAGLYPASRAARLDPVESLRRE